MPKSASGFGLYFLSLLAAKTFCLADKQTTKGRIYDANKRDSIREKQKAGW